MAHLSTAVAIMILMVALHCFGTLQATDITIQNDTGYDMQLSCDDLEETVVLQNQAALYLLDPPKSPQHCCASWNDRAVSFLADNTIAGDEANWDFIGDYAFLNSVPLTDVQANTWNTSAHDT